MDRLFLQVLNMSFTASFVILGVLITRLFLKKAPHIIGYSLWAVVLFRLVCPFSFESGISLLPIKTNPISPEIVYQQTPQINTGIPIINDSINKILPSATPELSMNPLQGWIAIGITLWIIGIILIVGYSTISIWMVKRRLQNAQLEDKNIYLVDGLETPFVMGIFCPNIYLPKSLAVREKEYILLHEQMHIRRFDHVIKLLSFAVVCLHWFNPLVWVAFSLCGKDMEMSCDEAVIKQLGSQIKKDYTSSLLSLATGKRIVGGFPIAFGEGDTRNRIKNVLSYKKPTIWVAIAATLVVLVLGFGLITNPKGQELKENMIYTADLTTEQKAVLTTRYKLDVDSSIFQTKFHVSDNIKSYAYFVEAYEHGRLLDTYVAAYGNLDSHQGEITTGFSMNHGADNRWMGIKWTTGMVDGGYSTYPSIPFPTGYNAQGISTVTLTNEGNSQMMPKIIPEEPIIIASIPLQSSEESSLTAYSCAYLMDNPDAIAQYACVYLVKCVFSEDDEATLAKTLFSSPS